MGTTVVFMVETNMHTQIKKKVSKESEEEAGCAHPTGTPALRRTKEKVGVRNSTQEG